MTFRTALAAAVVVIGAASFWASLRQPDSAEPIPLEHLLRLTRSGEIDAMRIDSHTDRVTAEVGSDTFFARYPAEYEDELTEEALDRSDVEVTISDGRSFLSRYGTAILFGGVMLLVVSTLAAGPHGHTTKRKRPARTVPDTRFADVIGADEVIEDLEQLVDFLKHPDHYRDGGMHMPRGVLLHGPPGVGKTLLAKAVAGEAGVPFFPQSGPEFVRKYIGEGAGAVRSVFAAARDAGPSLVFIDEIDAIGADRDGGDVDVHHEHNITLDQLLVELDGTLARNSSDVVVIAATNRRHALDPALVRPGRLDRDIALALPDLAARRRLWRLYAERLPSLDPEADLEHLARISAADSGAGIAKAVNEAALLSNRLGVPTVTTEHFQEALATVKLGHARPSADVSDADRRTNAVHEAGHALTARLLPHAPTPYQVTIVPRGESGGATWMVDEDRQHVSRARLEATVTVKLAGRAAERLVQGEAAVSANGAAHDLKEARELVVGAVCAYGIGSVVRGGMDPGAWMNDPRAQLIADEVEGFLAAADERATALLMEHRSVLDALIALLLERNTITGVELDALVPMPEKTVEGATT